MSYLLSSAINESSKVLRQWTLKKLKQADFGIESTGHAKRIHSIFLIDRAFSSFPNFFSPLGKPSLELSRLIVKQTRRLDKSMLKNYFLSGPAN